MYYIERERKTKKEGLKMLDNKKRQLVNESLHARHFLQKDMMKVSLELGNIADRVSKFEYVPDTITEDINEYIFELESKIAKLKQALAKI